MLPSSNKIQKNYPDNSTENPYSKLLYVSFDVVPAPKGAAIHIDMFVKALAKRFKKIHLITVSPSGKKNVRFLGESIQQIELPALGKTLIDRVLHFRQNLWQWLQTATNRQPLFDTIHIRSPFEGFPIALHKPDLCRYLIFEVNGLPSIELKYRYPNVADDGDLLKKLVAQEDCCLRGSDRVITPSQVTYNYLLDRKVSPEKLKLIPNGVDLEIFQPLDKGYKVSPDSNLKLLYFGTLSPWQGVDLAVDALALCRRDWPAELIVIGPGKPSQVENLKRLAQKLDVSDWVRYLGPMALLDLARQVREADVVLAPLKSCDRNLLQGCCPLKVLEGMASGVPVITTDLPVVRAIATPDVHVLAVKPNSTKAIKDALLRLRLEPELGPRLALQARAHVERHYSWSLAQQRLVATYEELLLSTHGQNLGQ